MQLRQRSIDIFGAGVDVFVLAMLISAEITDQLARICLHNQ